PLDLSLPCSKMQRREAPPVADELGVIVLAVHAGNLRRLRCAASAPSVCGPASTAAAAGGRTVVGALSGKTLLFFFGERRQVDHLRRHHRVGPVSGEDANDVRSTTRRGEGQRRFASGVLL